MPNFRYTATVCYHSKILDLCFLLKCLHGEIDININTCTYNLYSQIPADGLPTKEHYFI